MNLATRLNFSNGLSGIPQKTKGPTSLNEISQNKAFWYFSMSEKMTASIFYFDIKTYKIVK